MHCTIDLCYFFGVDVINSVTIGNGESPQTLQSQTLSHMPRTILDFIFGPHAGFQPRIQYIILYTFPAVPQRGPTARRSDCWGKPFEKPHWRLFLFNGILRHIDICVLCVSMCEDVVYDSMGLAFIIKLDNVAGDMGVLWPIQSASLLLSISRGSFLECQTPSFRSLLGGFCGNLPSGYLT